MIKVNTPFNYKDWAMMHQNLHLNTLELYRIMCTGIHDGYDEFHIKEARSVLEQLMQSADRIYEAYMDMKIKHNQIYVQGIEDDLVKRSLMSAQQEILWVESQQLIADQEAAYYEKREAQD